SLANPKTAPYGKAAMQAIKKAGLYKKLESKFVYAESISQTLSYALTAVEIGIVAKSSLYSSKMQAYKEDVNWKEVDSSLYKAIEQGIVLLKYGSEAKGYKDFYDFILSKQAQNIFKKYGYTL
ncbi:molybdate ABC transporter substrate-binding protein, partial [Sulfurimonas sp. MAG313]